MTGTILFIIEESVVILIRKSSETTTLFLEFGHGMDTKKRYTEHQYGWFLKIREVAYDGRGVCCVYPAL